MKRSHWTLINKLLLVLAGLFFYTGSFAQSNTGSEDLMRSNGKIYVVVAVISVILTGFLIALIGRLLVCLLHSG